MTHPYGNWKLARPPHFYCFANTLDSASSVCSPALLQMLPQSHFASSVSGSTSSSAYSLSSSEFNLLCSLLNRLFCLCCLILFLYPFTLFALAKRCCLSSSQTVLYPLARYVFFHIDSFFFVLTANFYSKPLCYDY